MSLNYKVSGVWKKTEPYVNVNGVWKLCTDVYVNNDGAWQSVLYEPGTRTIVPPFVDFFTVPAGVYNLNFVVTGGSGGPGGSDSHGGYWGSRGDTATGNLIVTPGQKLILIPGFGGSFGLSGQRNGAGGSGGYKADSGRWAGGAGGRSGGTGASGTGGGGGSAAVIIEENATNPLVVAGGGGGGAGGGNDSNGHAHEPVNWLTKAYTDYGSPVGYGDGWNLAQGGSVGDAGQDKIYWNPTKLVYESRDGGGGGGGGGGYPRGGAGGSLVSGDNGAWSGWNGQSFVDQSKSWASSTTVGDWDTTVGRGVAGRDGSISITW